MTSKGLSSFGIVMVTNVTANKLTINTIIKTVTNIEKPLNVNTSNLDVINEYKEKLKTNVVNNVTINT
jgi:hypothetical protein